MPKENPEITSSKISARAQIITAILALIGVLATAYWQFVLKPGGQVRPAEIEYTGRVVNVDSQQPIAGAKVTLDLQGISKIVYTDSEGVYRFKVAIESTVGGQVRVDAPGYQVYTRNITISPQQNTMEDVKLTPLEASAAPTETFTPSATIAADTKTPTEVPTQAPSSGIALQLVGLVDSYYSCINLAEHNNQSDYRNCWNGLSTEYQSIWETISGVKGYKSLMNYWNGYKIGYALYFCPKYTGNFVDAIYYRYLWNDVSKPIEAEHVFEYSFGLDANGWKITSGNSTLSEISPECEDEPRIEKWTPNP